MSNGKVMSTVQKIFAGILGIISLFCLGICSWYVYIVFFAPQKIVSNTYEVGMQTSAKGDEKYFMELKYFTNKNNNGLECFEIKYNYLLDENKSAFYSQGLQFVTNTTEDKLGFEYAVEPNQAKGEKFGDKGGWYDNEDYYRFRGSYQLKSNATTYNYMSGDDYNTSLLSTNPISVESCFRVQLGDDIFLMKFKGKNTEMNDVNLAYKEAGDYHFYVVFGSQDYNFYYVQSDPFSFSYMLYNSLQSAELGTNRSAVFEFGDWFDYYKYENGVYQDTAFQNMDLVKTEMASYYAIKIEVVADGIQNSHESLFNRVHGSATYKMNGGYEDGSYFAGQNILTITQNDFDLVEVIEGTYALKLSNQFLEAYQPYMKDIGFKVVIDLDWFKEKGYQFFGFTQDHNLDKLNIVSCMTRETVAGQVIEKEVAYE